VDRIATTGIYRTKRATAIVTILTNKATQLKEFNSSVEGSFHTSEK
jgi:hypothetical protein